MSATTLASENVPILYTEFNTSSCYRIKKKLASGMKWKLESGVLRTSPFANKPCHKLMSSLYWNTATGNAKVYHEGVKFGFMELARFAMVV